jgi:hypothetical protein
VTGPAAIPVANVLGTIPDGLRAPLLEAFNEIIRNFRERRWEPAELNGGKLSEVIYSILRGHIDGTFPTRPSKPSNMLDACKSLEAADQNLFPRSIRIQIPRILIALYEVRNNRGVGHVGGDVNPNQMDAVFVLSCAKWLLAELIRLFHKTDTATATATVEALTERDLPIVWEVGGQRRVLNIKLTLRAKMLLLLYSVTGAASEAAMASWLEQESVSVFRRDVVIPAHKAKLVEFDRKRGTIQLSPLGSRYVEEQIPLTV